MRTETNYLKVNPLSPLSTSISGFNLGKFLGSMVFFWGPPSLRHPSSRPPPSPRPRLPLLPPARIRPWPPTPRHHAPSRPSPPARPHHLLGPYHHGEAEDVHLATRTLNLTLPPHPPCFTLRPPARSRTNLPTLLSLRLPHPPRVVCSPHQPPAGLCFPVLFPPACLAPPAPRGQGHRRPRGDR